MAGDVGDNFEPRSAIYHTQVEAEVQALSQIALYESWENQGFVRLIKSVNDLENHLMLWKTDHTPGLVMLMEGADPIVHVSDLQQWWKYGLRMIGLTFGDTHYGTGVAGGSPTFKKGGLTADGFALLGKMAELGFIWDISHLTEDGIWQGLSLNYPRGCASHANVQALTPSNRHLSDNVIRAIADRNGVMGLTLYNGFLEPQWKKDKTISVTLQEHLLRHATYVANLVGWNHVGIGSDLDWGFGVEESPVEIENCKDLTPLSAWRAVLSSYGIIAA